MSSPRALRCAPGARRALAAGRCGHVQLRFSRGAYLKLAGEWALLGCLDAPFGPLSLAVDGLEALDLEPGREVRVDHGRLRIGDGSLSLERSRERPMVRIDAGARASEASVASAADAARKALPAPPARLESGIEALTAGRVREAVGALAGLGDGLTPAGDDVLAGYAAAQLALASANALASAGARVSAGARPPLSSLAAGRASSLGLAYLRCAERGELPDAAARLLLAIRAGSPDDVRAALPRLREWGATTGIALAWGMLAAVADQATRERNHPAPSARGG